MLEKQYAGLHRDKDCQADAPPFVSFDAQEVGGAAKDIERDGKAGGAHTQDVLGVERFTGIFYYVGDNLGYPEGIH
jgi:hypothetical protein